MGADDTAAACIAEWLRAVAITLPLLDVPTCLYLWEEGQVKSKENKAAKCAAARCFRFLVLVRFMKLPILSVSGWLSL